MQEEKFKKLLFEKLDGEKISFFTKIGIQLAYFFYGYFVRPKIKKAFESCREDVFTFIEKQKQDQFKTLQNQTIKNFTRYLSILGGAYKTIANKEVHPGTLSEMVKMEFEKKELNQQFQPQELYREFAQTILKKAEVSLPIAWIIKLFVKKPEKTISSLIDSAASSLQNKDGYTHALNCVLREQLDTILKLLKDDLAEKNKILSPSFEEEKKMEGQKPLIAELVKHLFPILRKSKCSNVEELEKLLKGELVGANVNQAIDGLFIEEVLEKVTSLLATATQSLVQEEQLQKLTYTFAHLVNKTFEGGDQVTVQEMEAEKRAIATRSEEILQLAVTTAVQEKFDLSGKKEQNETNGFIKSLHAFSQNYFDGKEGTTGAIKDLEELANMDLLSHNATIKIDKLVDEAQAYATFGNALSLRAKESTLNSNNKNEINNRYFNLAEQSTPYIEAIAEIRLHSRSLKNVDNATPDLNEILKIAPSIHTKLFTGPLTAENIHWAEGQVKRLGELLHTLGEKLGADEAIQKMVKEKETLEKTLIALRNSFKIQSLSNIIAPGSIIDTIAQQKKNSLGILNLHLSPNKTIASLKEQLKLSLSTETNLFFPELLKKLETIEKATLSDQIDGAHQEFVALMRQVITKGGNQVEESRKQSDLSYKAIVNAIDTSKLLEPNAKIEKQTKIKKAIVKAQEHLKTLRKWEEENIKEVHYINDFSFGKMKWVEDLASGLVYNRVRDHLDGLFEFLRKEETYGVGVFRHLFLIPHMQKVRGE